MPYNFKVWAHPLDMMSASWQGDRVPNVDVGRILENLLENRDDVSWGPNNKFKFPLLGTGMLYDRMADALPKPVNLGEEVAIYRSILQVGDVRERSLGQLRFPDQHHADQ